MPVRHLGLVDYREALEIQLAERERVWAGESGGTLFLCEHPPVYTLGRRAEPSDLPMGEDWYRSQGIDVVRVERGGRLTYHGPGQLVGYPVWPVARVRDHVCALEVAVERALAREGIEARGRSGEGSEYAGVWVEDRKIASVGIHVSRGVAVHGFAVNVENDLQPFEWAVACGLPDTRMTSVHKESGRAGRMDALAGWFEEHLQVASVR